jgi:hypothetical protein
LIFVNDLHDLAVQENVQQASRTVGRGASGTGIVEDGLPWQGKSVEDRLDKLSKRARDAKRLFDDSRDEEYGEEAVAIYNRLRATWERALGERYVEHILCMAVRQVMLAVWDSTRKKIWNGGVILL